MRTLLGRVVVTAVVCLSLANRAGAVQCFDPAPIAPADNATVPFGSVTFSWDTWTVADTGYPEPDSYELKVSIDGSPDYSVGNFPHPMGSKNVTIGPGRTVDWYVVTHGASCTDQGSVSRTFTTSCPTTPASLLKPGNNDTVPAGSNFTFEWSAVDGAAGYDVKVSPDGGTTWNVIADNLTVRKFTTSLTQGTYLWEVRANFDGACSPLYSSPRTLNVVQSCDSNDAPALRSPAAGATETSPVLFKWSSASGAKAYRLFAQKTGGTPILLTTTTRTEYEAALDPGTWEWLVVAIFEDCPDVSSERRSLTIDSGGCPATPGKATLTSPAAGATDLSSPVTFKWNAVSGATGYRVLALLNGSSDAVSLGLTDGTSLTADLPAGTHLWAVQTIFGADCPSTVSDRSSFTVTKGATCSTTPPTLLSPANGATNVTSPVTFSWSKVDDAIRYRLFVAAGDDDFAFYGETENTSLTRLVPAGVVKWAVVAEFAGCPEVRSAVSQFTVTEGATCPDASIALVVPAEGTTVTSPVGLTWTSVANAIAYRVWVSIDDGAPVAIARTTSTQTTISLPAGAVEWRVEALRDGCRSILSDKGHFTVGRSANCGGNAAPTLVSPVGPANDRVHASNPVSFVWTAAPNAIAYRVWVAREGQPFQDVALTRELTASVELEDGHFEWYVDAVFEGCDPVSSAHSFFEIEPNEEECGNAPTPLSPVAGALETSPVTFRWTAVPFALKYRVFVAINDEDPLFIGATEDTQLERPLPPGNIVWSVEAVFDDCPSAFSPRVAFTISRSQNCQNAAPEGVAPANGAQSVIAPVEFVWNAVSGATHYALVVEIDEGAPTILATTRETRIERRLPPGSHVEWWVVAFFASCEPTQSPEYEFDMVEADASCPRRAPILLLPAGDGPAVVSPVQFDWIGVAQATGYRVWAWQGDDEPAIIASTTATKAHVALSSGRWNAYIEATFDGCAPVESAPTEFTVADALACGTPRKAEAQVVGQALSNTSYRLRWTPLPNVSLYEVQEATSLDFETATTFTTDDVSMSFKHEVTGAPVQYLYRVRGVSSCNDSRGTYSDVVGVFIVAPKSANASAELGGTESIVRTIFLPGPTVPLQFAVTTDKPWLHVAPASGTLPPEGITLTITSDPGTLGLGTNTGTIRVTYSGAGKDAITNGTTSSVLPVSLSLVTPVTPGGKSAPPPDALIFPVAGHAAGANDSLFESDIRITNLNAQTMKYQVNFTPSATDGTQKGSSTTIEIAPNATIALDDIVASVFGTGTTSSALGMLEVRPLTTTSTSTSFFSPVTSQVKKLMTAASSRTYNFTPNGTFGQYIPAIPFSQFVGKAASGAIPQILSLQQVTESQAYRANFGFAEASGQAVTLDVRVYDTANNLLKTIPVSLGPSEHRQLNGMLSLNGITSLADGRVEVEVTGGNGKITAYVSEIDNQTNDPLLVSATVKGNTSASRYVVPGMAYINNGFAFWVSDLRIFNAGTSATPATLTFYPQGNPAAAVSKEITLNAGEIEVLDNVVATLFGQPNGAGGSIAITTPATSTLTATARTYNQTSKGTYGQYIPGVTNAESVGAGDRALQILQLEQSSRFRTNVGLAETSGQPVTAQISVIIPDSLATPVVNVPLQANEFRQISLAEFGLSDVYNARVTVKVLDGAGRITAYGSAIDVTTQDPTYVPAQ